MKVVSFLLFCLLSFPFSASSGFAAGAEKSILKQEILAVIQNYDKKKRKLSLKNYSFLLWNLGEDAPLVSLNENTPLIPASNAKIATTIAALKLLGLDYRFSTKFYYDGEIKDGILYGSLYVQGGGDPSITAETMWLIAKRIRNLGIHTITGNIYGDDSFFDKQVKPREWNKRERNKPFLALISALSFNYNSIEIRVSPDKEGKEVLVSTQPSAPAVRVRNFLEIKRKRRAFRIASQQTQREILLTLRGTLRRHDAGRTYYQTVRFPALFFLTSLRQSLKEVGVSLEGDIALKHVPAAAKPLHEHKSKPIALIIRDLNKFSSNFIANHLIKTIAAEKTGKPGSFAKGVAIVKDFLTKQGLATESIVIQDGSGLSMKNRMTTRFLVDALRYAYHDLSIFPEVLSSLSIMGVDGSVRKWMVDDKIRGKIRVKTGTLSHAVSLSGYMQAGHGKLLAFSMIFNNFNCCVYNVREVEKEVLLAIMKHYRRTHEGKRENDGKKTRL